MNQRTVFYQGYHRISYKGNEDGNAVFVFENGGQHYEVYYNLISKKVDYVLNDLDHALMSKLSRQDLVNIAEEIQDNGLLETA